MGAVTEEVVKILKQNDLPVLVKIQRIAEAMSKNLSSSPENRDV